MGNHFTAPHLRGYPDSQLESKYDPLFGFPKGRKKRVMHATEVEMESAKIPWQYRDYCAHKMIKLKACRRDNNPFFGRCHDYQHAWEECQYQDQILRMKEYERERRLDERQERIKRKTQQGLL